MELIDRMKQAGGEKEKIKHKPLLFRHPIGAVLQAAKITDAFFCVLRFFPMTREKVIKAK
jgi:hypothetical protein